MIFTMKRVAVEVGAMIVIMSLLFLLGLSEASPIGVALFMYKALLFSGSQVHAMIMRKLFFPYISFSKDDTGSKAMVIALHVAAAFVYAYGG